jgi:hypothetical protein
MKITFSYSPDESKLANKITTFIMSQYPECGARVHSNKELNQHGFYHRYITSVSPEKMDRARAKGLANAVKAVNRRLDKLEGRVLQDCCKGKKTKTFVDFQNDVKRLKAHFENGE